VSAAHQPSAINHQPSAINHQPSTISHQPSAINHQPNSRPTQLKWSIMDSRLRGNDIQRLDKF